MEAINGDSSCCVILKLLEKTGSVLRLVCIVLLLMNVRLCIVVVLPLDLTIFQYY